MPGIIVFITAASLLLGGMVTICLHYLLFRRRHERLHPRAAVITALTIASFLAMLGLFAISISGILNSSTTPRIRAVSIMIGALGILMLTVLLHRRGQRLGLIAAAIALFTFGTSLYTFGYGPPSDLPILLDFTPVLLIIVGGLHQGSVIEARLRQAGRFVAVPVNLDARLMRVGRLLLAIACGAALVADGIRLISPGTVWLPVGTISIGILCAGASLACLMRQYAYPWLA